MTDCISHRGGVKVYEGQLVGGWVSCAVCEEVGDRWEEAGLEGFLHGSGARRSCHYWVGWV